MQNHAFKIPNDVVCVAVCLCTLFALFLIHKELFNSMEMKRETKKKHSLFVLHETLGVQCMRTEWNQK